MTGYVGPIEALTWQNAYFRQVLFTDTYAQFVAMCLQPGESSGDEVHLHVVVPSETYHNATNTSATQPVMLRTVDAPPNPSDETIHKTTADAAEAPTR